MKLKHVVQGVGVFYTSVLGSATYLLAPQVPKLIESFSNDAPLEQQLLHAVGTLGTLVTSYGTIDSVATVVKKRLFPITTSLILNYSKNEFVKKNVEANNRLFESKADYELF